MTLEQKLEAAQVRVVFSAQFFAPAVARLKNHVTDGVGTACTDGTRIMWDRAWLETLTVEVTSTVLCHEACHCLLGHLWRFPAGGDHRIWNMACDHAVNLMLEKWGEKARAAGRADTFPFPEPKSAYCCDPKFRGMCEESIYAALMASKGQQGKGPKTSKNGVSGAKQPTPAAHSMPDFGQMEKGSAAGDAEQAQKLREDWQRTLFSSVVAARSAGHEPGGFERVAADMLSEKVPWNQILRNLLRDTVSEDWDWQCPAMEYSVSGFILPSLKSERVHSVMFATDTSGSISEADLSLFRAEKQNALDTLRPATLVDLYFDAKVQAVREYEPGDTIGGDAPGGGGTSFVPVWKHVAKMSPQPRAIVVLTDLCGDFGDPPGVPVIWVTQARGGSVPFGELVRIE